MVGRISVLDETQHDGVRPAVSDFYEAWATVPGYLSYRSTYKGIQAFTLHLFSVPHPKSNNSQIRRRICTRTLSRSPDVCAHK